jgi:iron complex outermembrane receptor protein
LSPINIDNPVHPSPGPALAGNNNPTTQGVDNYGIYLQDQIKLPYNVEVMGGFRYQYVRTTSDAGFGPGGGISVQAIDDAATARVGLSWQPQSWLSLYGNYTENFGAQAGARQFKAGTTGAPLPPQRAQQWEFGAKTEFFGGRLRASFAYYDLTKQNVATADTKHITECNGPCSIAAGEVNSHGPEFDIQGELMPGWNVIATYANQDVRITESKDTIATNNQFLKGQRLPFVPRNVGSFWTTYEPQQDLLKGFKIGGGVNLQDSVVDGTNSIKSPGYVLVGLMASYSIDVGKTKITTQLNVDNLLDKSYYKNASAFGDGAASLNFSTPRTFMGSINVQY